MATAITPDNLLMLKVFMPSYNEVDACLTISDVSELSKILHFTPVMACARLSELVCDGNNTVTKLQASEIGILKIVK